MQAGTLACNTGVDFGVIVGSSEALSCTFTPSMPGPIEFYSGTITKLGLDLGATAHGVIVWLVYAPTSRRIGELAGTYAGLVQTRPSALDLARMSWLAARTGPSRCKPFRFTGKSA